VETPADTDTVLVKSLLAITSSEIEALLTEARSRAEDLRAAAQALSAEPDALAAG
jgi:hypothetical protein